ncbi:hypothetical protein PoB_005445900 [Plakobranchus ocellatus]|uniref:Uncharacterized protein n=1 Tax=Plakobranchus ocellatus TaxID=259542 RepID=A0AAV4CA79_9GAST|nr:hypothetical protein PoB_005445900 [Plakobranchus ocellatus]
MDRHSLNPQVNFDRASVTLDGAGVGLAVKLQPLLDKGESCVLMPFAKAPKQKYKRHSDAHKGSSSGEWKIVKVIRTWDTKEINLPM